MKLVVNHLTRMQAGYICVAGLDAETGDHVRPVLGGRRRLTTNLLARNGGPFDMGVLVDLGATTATPEKPEVEDHLFTPADARATKTVEGGKFWKLLRQLAQPKLSSIFGSELKMRDARSCGVDVGQGNASLGCLFPDGLPDLYLQSRAGRPDQIRLRVGDGEFDLDLGVTDIRLYGDDHVTPDSKVVKRVAKRLQSGEKAILSVGLTRASASSPEFSPVHWLQVNNVHLEGDPAWQLG